MKELDTMKTMIVNGANGYVASNLINSLLKQKYKVIALVRPGRDLSAEARMHKVLRGLNGGENIDFSNLEVYPYSLLDADFSIPQGELEYMFGSDVDYFHFAASLKYDEKSVDEIFSTNIQGVDNSIQVFLKYASKASRFFYVGTAYSCGRYQGVFKEQFYDNQEITAFRNYYEQSKRFGENVVRKYIEQENLNAHVVRLSQVVGNSQTGETMTDYGIFDFTRRMFSLANRYPNEVVKAHIDPESTQNLIPIDSVVSYFMAAVQSPVLPTIMNFVADESVKNKYIVDTLNRLLSIQIVPMRNLDRSEMNSIERLVAVGMSFTHNYTETNLKFDTSQREKVAQSPVKNNSEAVIRMLEFFIQKLSAQRKKRKSEAA